MGHIQKLVCHNIPVCIMSIPRSELYLVPQWRLTPYISSKQSKVSMIKCHGINSHKINSHKISSWKINSHKINSQVINNSSKLISVKRSILHVMTRLLWWWCHICLWNRACLAISVDSFFVDINGTFQSVHRFFYHNYYILYDATRYIVCPLI